MHKHIITVLTFICILYQPAKAEVNISIYPTSHQVSITSAANADTLSLLIENLSAEPITNFFITAITSATVSTIENMVDESPDKIMMVEVENGTIHIDKFTTRWFIDSINKSVLLRIQTGDLLSQEMSFCGSQPAPFFGIIEPVGEFCCYGMRGNIDYDEFDLVDISDLVYLVTYSFGVPNGPSPVCFDEADVDATGELDIADIVYLVNFMFIPSSPYPQPCPN